MPLIRLLFFSTDVKRSSQCHEADLLCCRVGLFGSTAEISCFGAEDFYATIELFLLGAEVSRLKAEMLSQGAECFCSLAEAP